MTYTGDDDYDNLSLSSSDDDDEKHALVVEEEESAAADSTRNYNDDGILLKKTITDETDSVSSSSSSVDFDSEMKGIVEDDDDDEDDEEEEGMNAGTKDFLDWLQDDDDDDDNIDDNERDQIDDDIEDEEEDPRENDNGRNDEAREVKRKKESFVLQKSESNDDGETKVNNFIETAEKHQCKNENSDNDDGNDAETSKDDKTKAVKSHDYEVSQNGSSNNSDKLHGDYATMATTMNPSSSSSNKQIMDKSERAAIQMGTTSLLNRLCSTSDTFNYPKDAENMLHSLRSFAKRDAKLVVHVILNSFSSPPATNRKKKQDSNKNATCAIISLMRKHTSSIKIQEEGCAVLCNLCSIPCYRQYLYTSKLNDSVLLIVLKALQECGVKDELVSIAGFTALSNLCRCGASTSSDGSCGDEKTTHTRQIMTSYDVISVIQNVMIAHSTHTAIQRKGSKILDVLLPQPLTPQQQEELKRKKEAEAKKLNVCYEALEKMRRLNLEVELGSGTGSEIDFTRCTQCLREEHYRKQEELLLQQQHEGVPYKVQQQQQQPPRPLSRIESILTSARKAGNSTRKSKSVKQENIHENKNNDDLTNDNHLHHPRHSPRQHNKHNNSSNNNNTLDGPKKLKKILPKTKKSKPCLICGSPTCKKHSCPTFRARKEGGSITICCNCAPLFTLDFIIDCVSINHPHEDNAEHHERHMKQKQQKLDQMIDAYDRALLILRYSSQYLENISSALQQNTKRNNHIGLGSSATGIVSGITGVAAAAAIFTPVGPPLLIASLLFGGSATAASTSSEAVNYYSEPNRLADKIIALHTMVHSILRVSSVLRDALLRNHIRLEDYLDAENKDDLQEIKETLEQIQTTLDKESVKIPLQASRSTVNYAVAGAEIGILASRNARFLSRATTNVMRTARIARFAGGALSAATIVMDAREMRNSVMKIKEGNVCEKADLLLRIKEETSEFPETSVLSGACDRYLEIMSTRRRREELEGGEEVLRDKDGSTSRGGTDAQEVQFTHQGIG